MMKIAVFCASSAGRKETYLQAAEALGRAMARRGCTLVYGGGGEGLMGAAARGALAEGGCVMAVHTRRFAAYADALTVTDSVMTETLAERKAVMAACSDGFIALPGSMGTLDEVTEMFVLTQLGFQRKPVGLLNVNGYFEGLLLQLRRAVEDGFMKEADFRTLLVAEEPEALLSMLESASQI